jgi:hypothetical protein
MPRNEFSVPPGHSVRQAMQNRLDTFVAELKEKFPDGEPAWSELDPFMIVEEILPFSRLQSRARGAAEIIAVFENPYEPDVAAVRQAALERWEKNNGSSND